MIIELVPHLDAGDRALWRGEPDERPLSDLGRMQSVVLARTLTAGPPGGLYSSPALRCRQTLEPVSDLTGAMVVTVSDLGEGRPGEGIGVLARRGVRALEEIVRADQGRAVVCSHGDIIPATIELLVERHGLTLRSRLGQRGEWYTITLDSGQADVILNGAPDGFPR